MTHAHFMKRSQSATTPDGGITAHCVCNMVRLGCYWHIGPAGLERLWKSRLIPIGVWHCSACDLVYELAPFDTTLPLDYAQHPGLYVVATRIDCYPYSTAYRPGRARP